jgi:hypothetical protein
LALPAFTLFASLGIDYPQSASFRAVAASDYATSTRDGGQRNGSEHECETQAQNGAKAAITDGAASCVHCRNQATLLLEFGLECCDRRLKWLVAIHQWPRFLF